LVALVVAVGVFAIAIAAARRATAGHFVYTLDDTYIYMAIAKNLVNHGVWGTTPHGFASATSSPLWLLLLAAAYATSGVNQIAPLVMNLVFAVALLAVCARVLRAFGVGDRATAALLVAIVAFMPVVPVAMCGLEHLMHAATAVAFLALAVTADPDVRDRRRQVQLALAAMVMVAARYEGLFLLVPLLTALALRRRFGPALAIGAAAAVPVAAYGAFSLGHGWGVLPSSVLLKGQVPRNGWRGLPDLAATSLGGLLDNPELVTMLLASAGLLVYLRRRDGDLRAPGARAMSFVFATTILHLAFARTGSFYRYEAYLVVLWIVAVAGNLRAIADLFARASRVGRTRALTAATLAAVVLSPFLVRGLFAHRQAPLASRNIYEQQVQMALYLRDHHAGHHIAANDIGAINYFADIDNLDLAGLATAEIMRARLRAAYGPAVIDGLARARGVEMAVVYEEWFQPLGGLPRSWVKVGEWTIHDNVIAGRPTVAFFATSQATVAHVADTLRAFSPRLPPRVDQAGLYLQPSR
jgi:hypothetical protein